MFIIYTISPEIARLFFNNLKYFFAPCINRASSIVSRHIKYTSPHLRRGIVIYIKSLSTKERVSIVHAVIADKAVAALLALIDNGDRVIRVHILEHKELVPKQVHLKYRLLR